MYILNLNVGISYKIMILFLVTTHIFMFWLGCRFMDNINKNKNNDEQDS